MNKQTNANNQTNFWKTNKNRVCIIKGYIFRMVYLKHFTDHTSNKKVFTKIQNQNVYWWIKQTKWKSNNYEKRPKP